MHWNTENANDRLLSFLLIFIFATDSTMTLNMDEENKFRDMKLTSNREIYSFIFHVKNAVINKKIAIYIYEEVSCVLQALSSRTMRKKDKDKFRSEQIRTSRADLRFASRLLPTVQLSPN